MSERVFKDGDEYIVVVNGMPEHNVEIGIGSTLDEARENLQQTPMQSTGRDGGVAAALAWARHAGWIDGRGDMVIVEAMPEEHKGSHRTAGNWGVYPHNGAVRSVESRGAAEEIVAQDPDGYAAIIRDAEPIDWLDEVEA